MTEEKPKELSAMLTWMLDLAIELAKDDETAERSQPTTLEQRLAIGLLQARALEDRHIAGLLIINGVAQKFPPLMALSMRLRERSHKLEQLGLELAKGWPPTPETMPNEPWVELQ